MNQIVTPDLTGSPSPSWPAAPGARVVFLVEGRTATERQLLERWVARMRPAETDQAHVTILALPVGPDTRTLAAQLRAFLSDEACLLAPARVAWLPRELEGERSARLSDLLLWRDPRKPREALQQRILRGEPERCRIVVAQPATIATLNARARAAGDADVGDPEGFAGFV